jgi:hypothetical protein
MNSVRWSEVLLMKAAFSQIFLRFSPPDYGFSLTVCQRIVVASGVFPAFVRVSALYFK